MEVVQHYLTENECYKAGKTIRPKGIMLHSTGANNPKLQRYIAPDDGRLGKNQYGNHWNQPMERKVCVHAFIGKLADGSVAVYQTLPWNYRGWHCGSGKNGSGNDTHISIELCEDSLEDGRYFRAVYTKAAQLCARLCLEYGWNPLADGVILDHREGYQRGIASDHGDVRHWFKRFAMSMEDFRAEVARRMKEGEGQMQKDEIATLVREEVEKALGKHYATLGEVPEMYRRELDKLITAGCLKGRGGEGEELRLDMRENEVRNLVVMARVMGNL